MQIRAYLKVLDGDRSTDDHNNNRNDHRNHIHPNNPALRSVTEEDNVHNGGEDEGSQHISEVSDQSQNSLE